MEHFWLLMSYIGASLYLMNKVFLEVMERMRGKNDEAYWRSRQLAWGVYLLGLPPMAGILLYKYNLLFGIIEVGGFPSMLYGFITAMKRDDSKGPAWLNRVAFWSVGVGLVASLAHFGGIESTTQILEIFGSAGFLMGTYQLSNERQAGYLWFLLMNIATGILFAVQGNHFVTLCQFLSVACILDAYGVRLKHQSTEQLRVR